ncbi:cell division cycle protein 23 homolog isoform X2 [Mustela nigripes]|uniref:cell division cycle protein 23 homolog isoform X2 n=1 Tax=Mustela lutreola TaxID=9666 RepID=UPI00279708E4|nr:cell division cycle protein 23 homolog isoform X2 [Mustela lutreola]XP_059273629.1 cell division cycle protein 23 homolog isoform X2 [Mustela nigripes]
MAASPSVVPVAVTAAVIPVLSPSSDFSNLREIKKQLLLIAGLTRERGLLHSSKWSAELAFSLPALPLAELQPPPPITEEDAQDMDAYTLAKAYFDVKEYDRAAHFLHGCNSKKAYFLYMYSRYLSGEKKKDDETVDSLGPLEKGQVKNEALRELRVELSKKHQARELDGFGLYLYGVVLRKLDLVKEAIDVFVEATHVLPLHWGAWLELCNLITDKEMLKFLSLPDTWMKEFFLAHIYTELQLIEEALQKYQNLIDVGFSKSSYIVSQIAVAYHNIRDIDKALSIFNELRKQDPYRIENMDTFSNLLYVRSMKSELSYLAHNLCEIDKYRVETCCVIGNYYSLRSQHEKAALYFQRALKLNPRYLGAWTLMGHEYMEMKNTSAAIQAYRHAIEVNKRDYRAWYGLGQTYEILKMPFYCLYYYRRAHQLRLHEQLTESEQAAQCYIKYIQDIYSCGEIVEHLEESTAFRYLAQYYFKCKLWDEASTCAQKCCAFNDTREEGKALLRQILQLRNQGETPSTEMPAPFFLPASLSANNTPTRRVSPLNLSSVTP